jgi:hypothetical protein
VLAAALLAPAPGRAEAIAEFSAELFLEASGAFGVVERIRYDFGGEQRHGIYREIPLRGGEGFGEARDIAIDVREVTDEAGRERPYRVERGGGRIHLRIGDPDRTVTGVHEYRIRYRVRRALRFLGDRDELAWNVTGNEWKVPIAHAEARVHLPPGGEAAGPAQARCFAGRYGAKGGTCSAAAEGGSVAFAAERLGPAEGLTAVVALPKGVLRAPSPAALAFERLMDLGAPWLLLPLATFAGLLRLWRARGVDPGRGDAIPVRYEPPEGLTPAEAGTLLDERADLADLTATLLDLAVRGYLDLQEEETARFLLLDNRDYLLRKRRPADAALKPHERALFEALFDGRDAVRVSELRHKFHVHVSRVQSMLYADLSGKDGCFAAAPDAVRRRYRVAAGVLGFAAISIASIGILAFLAPFGLGASALLLAGFAPAMPRRTRRGRRLYEELLGFREFLGRVDKDRLERMGGRTTDRFEKGLPYAIVLGAADAWADAFGDLYAKPPDWYRSQRHARVFDPGDFVSDLGRSLGTIGRTLAEAPPSRDGGGSGFGGGFSGGGSGGGGGGSW